MEPMTSMAIASVAMKALGGLTGREQAKANKRLTKAENMLKKAQVDAANTIRDANNELGAATGALQRYRQSLGHQQTLKQSGRQQSALVTNINRALDDLNRGGVESRLESSFEIGALAAASSAAGVGGGSREMMNRTLRLSAARQQAEIERAGDQVTYDGLRALTNMKADSFQALDGSLIFDNIDQQDNLFIPKFAQPVPSPLQGLFAGIAGTINSNPAAAEAAFSSIGGLFDADSGPSGPQGGGGGGYGSATGQGGGGGWYGATTKV